MHIAIVPETCSLTYSGTESEDRAGSSHIEMGIDITNASHIIFYWLICVRFRRATMRARNASALLFYAPFLISLYFFLALTRSTVALQSKKKNSRKVKMTRNIMCDRRCGSVSSIQTRRKANKTQQRQTSHSNSTKSTLHYVLGI